MLSLAGICICIILFSSGLFLEKIMGSNLKKDLNKSHEADLLRYKNSFANILDLAYIVDKHAAFVDCNINFLKWIALKESDRNNILSVYSHMSQSGRWTENQVTEMKKKDIDVILSGESSLEKAELPSVNSQQEIRYFLTSRIPLRDEQQVIIGLFVILKDITAQKAMEDQMAKIKHQLELANAKEAGSIRPLMTTKINNNNKIRILVIEDNIMAQKVAQAVLMQIDCVVDVVDSMNNLISEFEPGKYNMVLMDIGLEETSGYMLAKYIRQQERDTTHHAPIIALTSYDATLLMPDCEYYQMEGAITKPLTIEQARQLVQHYIFNIDLPVTGLKTGAQPI